MMSLKMLRTRPRIASLRWWDVLILTLILFGQSIYYSYLSYAYSSRSSLIEGPEFTEAMNWEALKSQALLLLIALAYLWLRRFDFSVWKIQLTRWSILKGVLLFVGVALVFDVYFIVTDFLLGVSDTVSTTQELATGHSLVEKIQQIDLSLLFYSILNGFYEEFFFLGVCLRVEKKYEWLTFLYALIIRFSFHTYQGLVSALAIGFILGSLYYVAYRRSKDQNLMPFFLSHAIGDMLGLGLLSYIFF